MKIPRPLSDRQKEALVKIAWQQVKGFIADWQKSPYEWNKERDIQVEIVNRIQSIFRKLDKDKIWGKYKVGVAQGFKKGLLSRRIACEPSTHYLYKDKKRYHCFPDIVIYDDIEDPNYPPDDNNKKINCPMLWVCEIKYEREWMQPHYDNKKKDNWDLKKMTYLLRQKDGTRYACWLNIARKRALSGSGLSMRVLENKRLRVYNIRIPQ
ncbi:MAG: hypothetical protein WC532_06330 [Candidatus Omnitrophota bacterium]